jgi:hypothetical protein
MITIRSATLMACVAAAACSVLSPAKSDQKSHKLTSVSIRKMADSLHAVIAADRQSYAELLEASLKSGTPSDAHTLPGHAAMLRQANQRIQQRGAEFSYVLRSLWPLSDSQGPQTEIEQAGLEFVAKNPGQNFYSEEELGGRSYFTAIYPDRATLSSCVNCHNQHPGSPRRDFRPGDVMGAIVVRVPLEF